MYHLIQKKHAILTEYAMTELWIGNTRRIANILFHFVAGKGFSQEGLILYANLSKRTGYHAYWYKSRFWKSRALYKILHIDLKFSCLLL